MLKWRLVNPQILLGVGYASEAALGLLHNKANDFLARKAAASPAAEPAPPMSPRARVGGPPPGGGLSTGLDDAFNEVDPPEDPRMENLMKMAREAKRGPGPEAKDAPQKKKKKFGDQLLARAQEREERGREKDRSKEKAKRSRTRSVGDAPRAIGMKMLMMSTVAHPMMVNLLVMCQFFAKPRTER